MRFQENMLTFLQASNKDTCWILYELTCNIYGLLLCHAPIKLPLFMFKIGRYIAPASAHYHTTWFFYFFYFFICDSKILHNSVTNNNRQTIIPCMPLTRGGCEGWHWGLEMFGVDVLNTHLFVRFFHIHSFGIIFLYIY